MQMGDCFSTKKQENKIILNGKFWQNHKKCTTHLDNQVKLKLELKYLTWYMERGNEWNEPTAFDTINIDLLNSK